MTGVAGQLLWDTGRPDELTYSELREKLRRRFGSDDQQEKFQAELRARRRRKGETLAELYQDIRRLVTLAYPGEGVSSLCEQIAKDYFIASIGDRDFELKIRERAVRLEAYEKAVVDDNHDQHRVKGNRYKQDVSLTRKVTQLERKVEQAATYQSTARPVATSVPEAQETVDGTTAKDLKDAMGKLSLQNDELSKEVGRLRLLEERRKEASTLSTSVPATTSPPVDVQPTLQVASPGRPSLKCYYCGGLGRFARDCLKKKTQYDRNNGISGNDRENGRDAARGQTYLPLVINGKLSKCLLDTGSDITLLPTSLTAGLRVEPTDRRIRAANGTAIKVTGTVTVEARAGSRRVAACSRSNTRHRISEARKCDLELLPG